MIFNPCLTRLTSFKKNHPKMSALLMVTDCIVLIPTFYSALNHTFCKRHFFLCANALSVCYLRQGLGIECTTDADQKGSESVFFKKDLLSLLLVSKVNQHLWCSFWHRFQGSESPSGLSQFALGGIVVGSWILACVIGGFIMGAISTFRSKNNCHRIFIPDK